MGKTLIVLLLAAVCCTATAQKALVLSESSGAPVNLTNVPAFRAKLRVPLDVRDYAEATLDSADATTAFAAAMLSVQRSATNRYPPEIPVIPQGGVLEIPPGHYIITNSIRLVANTRVAGAGMGSTVIENRSTNDTFRCDSEVVGSGHQLVIENLTLIGPTNAPAGAGAGINLDDSSGGQVNFSLRHVRIFGHRTGVRLNNVVLGHLDDVWAVRCTGDGFLTAGSCNSVLFSATEADHVGGHGYNVKTVGCTFVSTSADYPTGDGYHLRADGTNDYAVNTSFVACGSEYPGRYCFYFELGRGINLIGAQAIGLSDHAIVASGTRGLLLSGVHAETPASGKNALFIETNAAAIPYGITLSSSFLYCPGATINATDKVTVAGTSGSDSWTFADGLDANSLVVRSGGALVLRGSGSDTVGVKLSSSGVLQFSGGSRYPSEYALSTGAANGWSVTDSLVPLSSSGSVGSTANPVENVTSKGQVTAATAQITNGLYMNAGAIVFRPGGGSATIGFGVTTGGVVRANVGSAYPSGWQFDSTNGANWRIDGTGRLLPSSHQDIATVTSPAGTIHADALDVPLGITTNFSVTNVTLTLSITNGTVRSVVY